MGHIDHSYWKNKDSVVVDGEKCKITNGERNALITIDVIFIACMLLIGLGVVGAYCFDITWLQWLK